PVVDVNEAPDGVEVDLAPLRENAAGADLGAVRVSDGDAGDTAVLSVDDPRFEVVAGRLKLKEGIALDAEAESHVTLRLTATDAGGLSHAQVLEIPVVDVNEAPDGLTISATQLPSSDDLVLWLDGQDRDGNFAPDAAGEVAEGAWVDKSGAGSTGFLKGDAPTVGDSGLDFSGTNSGYEISGNSDLNRGTFPQKTFALSFETGADISGVQMIYEQGGTVRGYSLSIAPDPDTGVPTLWGLAYNKREWDDGHEHKPLNLGAAEPNTFYNVALVHDATNPDPEEQLFSGYVDGVLVDQVDHVGVQYNHPDAAGIGNLNNGTVLPHTGKAFTGDIPFDGTISEAMSWNGALDVQEIAELDGHFLANRTQVEDGVSVFETAQDGAVVATLSASDPDAGDKLAYQIIDENGQPVDDPRFEIDGTSIKLRSGTALDHETGSEHKLIVQVTDEAGLSRAETLTVQILDVDEAATDITLDTTSVADTIAPGSLIGLLDAIDPEGGALSFGFVGASDRSIDHDVFEIVGNELRLRDEAVLRFEQQASFDLNVEVIDAGGNVSYDTITVDITDGNRAPTDITIDSVDVRSADFGAVVGRLEVVDLDAGDTHSFTVSDARFTVEDGALKLHDWADLDLNEDADLTLSVTATDAAGESVTEEMALNVADAAVVRVSSGFRIATYDLEKGVEHVDVVDWAAQPNQVILSSSIDQQSGTAGSGAIGTQITGRFVAPEDGEYTFHFPKNGSATLTIDGDVITPDDPSGSSVRVKLGSGDHGIDLRHVGEQEEGGLSLTWEGPGLDGSGLLEAAPGMEIPENGMIALDISIGADVAEATTAGFKANYFDLDHSLAHLDDVDWSADPDHSETVEEIDYTNSNKSFWSEGSADTFAAKLTGAVDVPEGGTFSFHLGADDGAMLYVDGEAVLDNDGLHAYRTRTAEIELEPGQHQIEVRYFENYGHAGLKLEWEGPGLEGRSLVTSDVEVAEDPYANDTIEITGLPSDTLVLGGAEAILSDGGPIDVTGWDMSVIEIAPPPNYAGTIDWGVRITPPDGSDRPIAFSDTFTLQVTDASGGVPDQEASSPDAIVFDAENDFGWAEDEIGTGSASYMESGESDEDVLSEEVMLLPDAEIPAEFMETHDRHDY
ncbi:PA14 domain-containing protein, partial [Meridianimarinicoccus aquatilis]